MLMIVSEVVVNEGRKSETVHILMQFCIVLFFSLKFATMNDTREGFLLKHCRRNFNVLLIVTHFEKVVDVRIVCFVHDGIIAQIPGNLNPYCDTLQTGFFA